MATVKAAAKTERRQADVDLRAQVLLSVQRALLGCITADMRLISVEWSPFRIHLHVYVDGVDGITREGAYEDFAAVAVRQIVADFPEPYPVGPQVSCTFHRCDAPQKPDFDGEVVYARREP
ncbi:MAG TPA: hypothetical protein VFE33_14940 [Thermoanaerobaculia bacterium]|nr:hypothetical protein [Thermoanaerobaculia bacterium]